MQFKWLVISDSDYQNPVEWNNSDLTNDKVLRNMIGQKSGNGIFF